jgi:hypothetical protein
MIKGLYLQEHLKRNLRILKNGFQPNKLKLEIRETKSKIHIKR